MIVVWFAMNCLREYLKLKDEGRLERPGRPDRCLERQCGQRKSYWRHGSYERTVIEASLAGKIVVERFKCKACGKTVSVLPLFVLPRRRFSRAVMSERVEGYCTSKDTSYRREANGPPKEPCSSPAQLWRWVELLARRADELLIDVQAACIRCDCDEESLIRADRAESPQAWKAHTDKKTRSLHYLAKLHAYGRRLLASNRCVLEQLGTFFLKNVDGVQLIFASEPTIPRTPQKMKPQSS